MPGRPPKQIKLSPIEREQLEAMAEKPSLKQRIATRIRIVLLADRGWPNKDIAAVLHVNPASVSIWRNRFLRNGLPGLEDKKPTGRPRSLSDEEADSLIVKTISSKPEKAPYWSSRLMAKEFGVSASTVRRIWNEHGIKPQLLRDVVVPCEDVPEEKKEEAEEPQEEEKEAEKLEKEEEPTFEAFGESKTVRQWAADLRCHPLIGEEDISRSIGYISVQWNRKFFSEYLERIIQGEYFWGHKKEGGYLTLHSIHDDVRIPLVEYAKRVGVRASDVIGILKRGKFSLEDAVYIAHKRNPKKPVKPRKRYLYEGKYRWLSEIAEMCPGVKYTAIRERLKAGMSIEEATENVDYREKKRKSTR